MRANRDSRSRSQHEAASTSRPRGRGRTDAAAITDRAPLTEDLLVRSYDHRRAYDVDVEIRHEDGSLAFHERYYLQPGATVSVTDRLPGGCYQVRVTLDNRQERVLLSRIDDAPEHTAVVEVGNGAVSLTDGLLR